MNGGLLSSGGDEVFAIPRDGLVAHGPDQHNKILQRWGGRREVDGEMGCCWVIAAHTHTLSHPYRRIHCFVFRLERMPFYFLILLNLESPS